MISYIREKLYYLNHKKTFDKLKAFKNIHSDKERCFILGNGPSLNKVNFSIFKNQITFGLNKIYLKDNFVPSYLVSVNKHVIEQSFNQFNKVESTLFLSSKFLNNKRIRKGNVFFLPDLYSRTMFHDRINQSICQGHTVTFVAIQLAVYMGFKEIILTGVDHNFIQNGKPNEVQKMDSDDLNHFSKDYFKGHDWNLADLEKSEQSYKIANKYAELNGIKILDATIDGNLQIFKKIKIND